MTEIKITKDYVGQRIDKVLVELLKDKTRTAILKLIEDGNILLNGNTFKASTKAKENDVITILDVEAKELDIEPKKMDLDIVYEDDDVAIINKPKGLTVHPGAGNNSDTLPDINCQLGSSLPPILSTNLAKVVFPIPDGPANIIRLGFFILIAF